MVVPGGFAPEDALLLGKGPRILSSTSSGSSASSTAADWRKDDPFAFLAEASREDDESLDTRDRDEPLGANPGLCWD